MKLLPPASFFQLGCLQRCCEATPSNTLTADDAVSVYRVAKRHAAAELCRFCEGFFLQNLDRLLDSEDFCSLLLGDASKGAPSGSGRDQNPDLLPVLRSLEAALIQTV